MTVISDRVQDVGYERPTSINYVYFTALASVRDSADDTRMIVRSRHTIAVNVADGSFTTDDLDPGPAEVRIGGDVYPITIPASGTPIRLWPLIQAGLPVTPESANHIASDGSVRREQVMTTAAYGVLTGATTPDPGSVFFLYN
jgi:hypothetical protein